MHLFLIKFREGEDHEPLSTKLDLFPFWLLMVSNTDYYFFKEKQHCPTEMALPNACRKLFHVSNGKIKNMFNSEQALRVTFVLSSANL